jgi:hypothetical protein
MEKSKLEIEAGLNSSQMGANTSNFMSHHGLTIVAMIVSYQIIPLLLYRWCTEVGKCGANF